ncbi:hypothetical protein [Elizabethkingia ursingii]
MKNNRKYYEKIYSIIEKNIGKRIFLELGVLTSILELETSTKPSYIFQKIVCPIKNEMDEISDISFNFEVRKIKNRITHFIFFPFWTSPVIFSSGLEKLQSDFPEEKLNSNQIVPKTNLEIRDEKIQSQNPTEISEFREYKKDEEEKLSNTQNKNPDSQSDSNDDFDDFKDYEKFLE